MVKTSIASKAALPSWKFLQRFSSAQMPASHDWGFISAMRAAAPVVAYHRKYVRLVKQWERRLSELGGDPSRLEWSEFRPLRLSREEDWSDWLAWLFANSMEGDFARSLFGNNSDLQGANFCRAEVIREEASEDQERRADILLFLRPRFGIHVEVKVGDEQFDKTLETSRKMHAKHTRKVKEWRNFVLMPEDSMRAWDESARRVGMDQHAVRVLLWKDVARSLRASLWSRREPIFWRAWAWSFCGAIEQQLLGLQRLAQPAIGINQFRLAAQWVELLKIEKGDNEDRERKIS